MVGTVNRYRKNARVSYTLGRRPSSTNPRNSPCDIENVGYAHHILPQLCNRATMVSVCCCILRRRVCNVLPRPKNGIPSNLTPERCARVGVKCWEQAIHRDPRIYQRISSPMDEPCLACVCERSKIRRFGHSTIEICCRWAIDVNAFFPGNNRVFRQSKKWRFARTKCAHMRPHAA